MTIHITNSDTFPRESARVAARGRCTVEFLLRKTVIGIFAACCAAQSVGAPQLIATPIAPGVYALLGSGGEVTAENGGRIANAAFVVGPGGIVVMDTGISYREGEEIIAAIKSVSAAAHPSCNPHPSQPGSNLWCRRIPGSRHSRFGAPPQRGVNRVALRNVSLPSAIDTW